MNIPRIKQLSVLLAKEELGLLKMLVSKALVKRDVENLPQKEACTFSGFYSNSPAEHLSAVSRLERFKLVRRSSLSSNDVEVTDLGLATGGFNGADKQVINSTDLIQWYEFLKID